MKKRFFMIFSAILVLGGITACSRGAAKTEDVKPVLKWVGVYQGIIKPGEDPIEREIAEASGYQVEYTMLPQEKGDEKLFLELASGTDYDIIKIPPAWYYKLVGQKAIIPIDQYLGQFGGNIKQAIEPESWKLTTYEGAVYGIPQKSERVAIADGTVIRKDLLDAMGAAMPETLDDFYACLKQLKQKYPDMIPLSAHPGLVFINTLTSAFGVYTEWADVNGKLTHRIHLPQTRQYFEFMAKLYREGLLDFDYPIIKAVNMTEKFTAGKAAAMLYMYTSAETVRPAIDKTVPGNKLAIVQPLRGSDGSRGVQTSIKLNYITCIPKTSKNPEHAMRFLNNKLDRKTFTYLSLGTEGETFTLQNGSYYPIMPIFNTKRNTAYWYLNGVWEKDYADMWLARVRRNVDVGNTFDELNLQVDVLSKNDITAFKPPLESFTAYEQVVNNLIRDNAITFISNTKDFTQYDSFVKNLDAAGLAAMTEELNVWYQTQK
jgi:putative aldouronate transport system substrate-binding protein